jgi:ATP-dependent Clp protease ATP-binding subunit ClpB
VLDDGRLTDSMGRTVSFKNTLIVMTSNLGSDAIVELGDGDEQLLRDRVMDALHGFFRPEMLNRIDETVIFRRLNREHIQKIVRLQLKGLSKRLGDRDLSISFSDSAVAAIAEEGYNPAFGARPVTRSIRKLVEDPLSYRLIAGDFVGASEIRVDTAPEGSKDLLSFTGDTAPEAVTTKDGEAASAAKTP